METRYSSKTLVSTYKTTHPRNLEDCNLNNCGFENLKTYVSYSDFMSRIDLFEV
jgi:hypothetical protein